MDQRRATDSGLREKDDMLVQRLVIFAVLTLVLGTAQAQGGRVDAKGGADHPLISRYAGSWLIGWRKQNFADAKPLHMLTQDIATAKKLDRNLVVEGEITELFYVSPAGRTALEVQRNYEDALKSAGAVLVYSCREEDWGCYRNGGPATELLLNYVVPRTQQIKDEHTSSYEAFNAKAKDLRLAVFTLTKGGDKTWITVYSVDSDDSAKAFANSASTYLRIIQPKSMDSGQVKVFDANQIAKVLGDEGKLALYGIYFDTGSAVLKPESDAQMAEMAKLLKGSAALRVFIVGHTDNQGAFEANLALSQKRAEAVTAALVGKHGVDARRLSAKGGQHRARGQQHHGSRSREESPRRAGGSMKGQRSARGRFQIALRKAGTSVTSAIVVVSPKGSHGVRPGPSRHGDQDRNEKIQS
jgi:OmpA-OmpF porin, OOP family